MLRSGHRHCCAALGLQDLLSLVGPGGKQGAAGGFGEAMFKLSMQVRRAASSWLGEAYCLLPLLVYCRLRCAADRLATLGPAEALLFLLSHLEPCTGGAAAPQGMYRFLKSLGMDPGGEFKAAMEEADRLGSRCASPMHNVP